jgi:hypothetical protein
MSTRSSLLPFFFLLVVLLMAPAASAIGSTITASQVSEYAVEAPSGQVIYQIIIDPLPMGTNQSHVLNYNGASFILTIGTAQSWGIYHDFDISLTHPNGTVESQHFSTTRVSGGEYKTTIQPVFSQVQSLTNAYWTIDLEVGLTPVSAGFNTQPADWLATSAIPFSAASGSLGGTTNVFVKVMTEAEFQENVLKYNPIWGFQNLVNEVFSWTWEQIIAFVSNIPVIGPHFISTFSALGTVAAFLVYWITWVILNSPLIIAGGEVLIVMAAVIMTGKDADGTKTAKKIYEYNVACITGFLWAFNLLWSWLSSAIQTIAAIIQGLKPI